MNENNTLGFLFYLELAILECYLAKKRKFKLSKYIRNHVHNGVSQK